MGTQIDDLEKAMNDIISEAIKEDKEDIKHS
jgi:hypothetical protein